MTDDEFAKKSSAFGGIIAESLGEKWNYLAALLKTRVSRFNEIPDQIGFFKNLPDYDVDLFNNKRNKVTPEKAAEIIPVVISILEKVQVWTPEGIDEILQPGVAESGVKMGTFMWPARIALSGQRVTPGGVTELLYLLGKEESMKRLNIGLDKVQG